jgi:cytochrome b561
MRWKSSGDRYGAVAIIIHWLTAAAVFGLLASGLIMTGTVEPDVKKAILRVHAPVGILVLLLTVARILWWMVLDRRPAAAQSGSAMQEFLARLVHLAFYPVLLVLGGSGVGMLMLSGAVPVLIGEGPLPDFSDLIPRGPHGIAAWALIGLAALHVAAAIHHQFVRRDRLLARMGVGANSDVAK